MLDDTLESITGCGNVPEPPGAILPKYRHGIIYQHHGNKALL